MRSLLLSHFEGHNSMMSWSCSNFIFDNRPSNCLISVTHVFRSLSRSRWVHTVLDILLSSIKNLGYLIFWSSRSIISSFLSVYINENKTSALACHSSSCFERLIFCSIASLSCLSSSSRSSLDRINSEASLFALEQIQESLKSLNFHMY